MPIDPVCGMTVDEQTAPATAVHNGTTYYFCAPGCKRTFEKNPDAVLKGGHKGMGHARAQMVTMTPMRQKPAPAAPTPAKAAYSIKPVSLTIPIEGMSCASCVAKIEHGLSAVPGVSRAAVNLATEQATVEYQPGATDPAAIQETIRSLGYTPVLPTTREVETPASKEERKQAACRPRWRPASSRPGAPSLKYISTRPWRSSRSYFWAVSSKPGPRGGRPRP